MQMSVQSNQYVTLRICSVSVHPSNTSENFALGQPKPTIPDEQAWVTIN